MGLFNCYVCEYSFVKQQQTPIKMYKLAGEERSYFGQFVASSYSYGHRLSSFYLAVWCSVAYSCEDILLVLCDKSGEKQV
ncbi:hypothetical protein F2Q69_00041675 [Brassica cretica]|uniref:Uncharacterized protein n=1 Tax=Brassica cretica TaxID=69181 RepID=A0A8S9N9E0_BRACR|nr:hypothetical protein F2Q69_00041675 [Brassica cretica]